MITRFSRKGAATASAVLCMSLPAAFLALHTGCASNPSEYKNPSPAISVFTTGTISGTTFTPTPASSTLAIASGGSAWLRANFGMKDGSAVVTPGNIPVESNVPFQISNIPATTTYTLTVTSGDGQKATATCTVTVLATPSGLTYTNEDAAYYVGVQIPTNTPTVAGAAPITYTVSPSLPSGLSLNASTGEITGSPQAVTTQATYTVTATNTVGSTTRAIKIAVAATPIDLSISPTATGPGGSAILTWNANLVSGLFSAVTITATPADSSLGTSFSLSGTKNVGPLMLTTTYTLSATPAAGGPAVTKSVDITVGSAPVNITGFTATPSVTPMGGTSALAWTLTGTPLTLTLDGADAFGTSGKTVTPIRRQTYTLSGSNVLNVSPATANVEVAARGLDIVAGSYGSGRGAADGDPDPNGFSRARFYRINAIAVDPRDGAVIVADYQSSTIRRIGPDRKVRTIAGIMNVQGAAGANTDATKLSQPAKLAVDPDTGDVYVGGEYFTTRRLLKLTCTGVGTYTASVPTFTANAGTTLPTAPNSNAFAVNNGNFYWVDFNTKMLYKTNTTTYATDMILDTSATFSGAASMAADFNGGRKLLYVACTGVSGAFIAKVFKIDLSPATPTATLIAGGATQSYIDHATDATLGTLNNCSGIAVDTSGNLYIADQLNAAVRMVPAGGLFQNGLVTIAGKVPTVPTTPIKGYLNASQTLGTVLPTNADTQATLSQNYTVAVQGDGTAGTKIYVGDNTSGAADTQSVRLITVSGTTTNGYPGGGTVYTVDDPARPGYTFAGGPIVTGAVDGMGTLAQFNFALPAATSENTGANLAALPDGSMTFAADTKNNLVRIIAANGAVT
ncbi:MAG: putative Ig domain-containing protein, partial [Holophaga sp.]|nr:putative Ig domain-containing protein [Holophaga sp.]